MGDAVLCLDECVEEVLGAAEQGGGVVAVPAQGAARAGGQAGQPLPQGALQGHRPVCERVDRPHAQQQPPLVHSQVRLPRLVHDSTLQYRTVAF